MRELWDSIVSEFSHASLTVLSDRQTAILGLVSAIALRTGWKHVAGYWLPLTVKDLLWSKTVGIIEPRRTGLLPSWSWLSVTSGVHFFPYFPPEDEYLADIQGVDGEDPTVPLRLLCLRLRLGPSDEELGQHQAPEGWPSRNFVTRADIPGSFPDEVYVLPLVWREEDEEYSAVEGILVSPSSASLGSYERVGSFVHEMWDEADEAEMDPVFEILLDVGRRESLVLV